MAQHKKLSAGRKDTLAKRGKAAKGAKRSAPKRSGRGRVGKDSVERHVAKANSGRAGKKRAGEARRKTPTPRRQPDDQVAEALILEVIAEPIEAVVVAGFDGVGDSEIEPLTQTVDLDQPVNVVLETPTGIVAIESFNGMSLGPAIQEIVEEWEEADQRNAVVLTDDLELRWDQVREIYDHPDFPREDDTAKDLRQ